MRIINPKWSAINQSTDPLKARANRRWWISQQKAGLEYLQQTHKYEMRHGQNKTGEFRSMLGMEAKALNDKHKQDFRDHVNEVYPAYAQKPLIHWTLVERNVAPLDFSP
jgi:hypothetical protein